MDGKLTKVRFIVTTSSLSCQTYCYSQPISINSNGDKTIIQCEKREEKKEKIKRVWAIPRQASPNSHKSTE